MVGMHCASGGSSGVGISTVACNKNSTQANEVNATRGIKRSAVGDVDTSMTGANVQDNEVRTTDGVDQTLCSERMWGSDATRCLFLALESLSKSF